MSVKVGDWVKFRFWFDGSIRVGEVYEIEKRDGGVEWFKTRHGGFYIPQIIESRPPQGGEHHE